MPLWTILCTVASVRPYDLPANADRERIRPEPGGYRSERGDSGSLPGTSLPQAEARYEKALALDPDLLEARLRLVKSSRGAGYTPAPVESGYAYLLRRAATRAT